MKPVFTFFFFNLILFLNAQPVIDASTNPEFGDVFTTMTGLADNNLLPGESGANASWDFSDVEIDMTIGNRDLIFVAAEETDHFSSFPDANFALTDTDPLPDQEFISYYTINNDGIVGLGFYTSTVTNVYDDTHILMEYPLGFGDSFSDSASSMYTVSGIENHVKVSDVTEADAYGSITTPSGTTNNVLRIRQETVRTDSIYLGADSYTLTTLNLVNYVWLKESTLNSVAGLSISSGESVSVIPNLPPVVTPITETKVFSWSNPQTTSVLDQKSIEKSFDIKILGEDPSSSTLSIEIQAHDNGNGSIKMFDVSGNMVTENKTKISKGNHSYDLQTDFIKSGNYIISVESEGVIVSKIFNKI